MLTEQQREFLETALQNKDIQNFINDVWWPMYDFWRESGDLPKVSDNPHVDKDLFALVGYTFSVRGAFDEMRINGIDSVLEKFEEPTIPAYWDTGGG